MNERFAQAGAELESILTEMIRLGLIGDRVEPHDDLARRHDLMVQWLPLTRKLANRQCRQRGGNFDDWMDVAQLSLVKAGFKFDFNRGIQFNTYLWRVVRRDFAAQIVLPEVSLSELEDDESAIIQLDADEPDIDGEAQLTPDFSDELRAALEALPSVDRFVVKATVFQNATLSEIADVIGKTSTQAGNIKRRAFQRLALYVQRPDLCVRQDDLFIEPPDASSADSLDRVPAERAG